MADYPPATWRLLRSVPADGATNMAMDEAILNAVAAGLVPPTLRFYAWEPACLSLGRMQPLGDADLQALRAAGVGLVRRPTGGKAILHVDELTYSVIVPATGPRVAGTILESYRRLAAALVRGLEYLGITGLLVDRPAGGRESRGPVCFEVPSDYEITHGGRKLVGSAQMRAGGVVLQHGTVPLCGDIARICLLLSAGPDPVRVRARATTVEEVLDLLDVPPPARKVTWEMAADAIALGFAETLDLCFESDSLILEEQAWLETLREEKYAAEAWLRRA